MDHSLLSQLRSLVANLTRREVYETPVWRAAWTITQIAEQLCQLHGMGHGELHIVVKRGRYHQARLVIDSPFGQATPEEDTPPAA